MPGSTFSGVADDAGLVKLLGIFWISIFRLALRRGPMSADVGWSGDGPPIKFIQTVLKFSLLELDLCL
jgi:hypothetical protein